MRKLSIILLMTILIGNVMAQQTINTPISEQTAATRQLIERNKEFTNEIIQLAPNVYTASGYDASNITMIIGDNGVILIDAGMIPSISAQVYEDFRKITDKPITGIIITHGHGDHSKGISAFLKDNTPQIWAAENFGREDDFPNAAGFKNPRSHRQNGMTIAPEVRINNGISPLVYPTGSHKKSESADAQEIYRPFSKDGITNFVVNPKDTINISGIELIVERTEGESRDHLLIYYPEHKVIFPGDQFYKSFPNLYAIRGTEYRDVLKWVEALDVILSYEAEAMAQGHTQPVIGKEEVKRDLTAMRDAIKYTFDKTIEGMNKGMTPDELVEYAALPDDLANNPNLYPYYGRQEWAIRNIFNGYMGWYDGNPTTLCPMPIKMEAEKFVDIAGGVKKVVAAARKAVKEGDYQWAAELADRLIALEPENRSYKLIKADALNGLADNLETATGRNFYNTVANELRE